jgi:ATP-dependent exoDNAse (exonuclease V) alpha subunit
VRDGFNRDHDPHLHTHVVVMNMTQHGDAIMALDGRQIMARDFNKVWGALYRANLAAKLKELGYSVSYTKKGELRMDAVSLEVEREFSGRRAEIQAKKDLGARDMAAWRETRKDKDPEIVKADVLAGWRDRVARHQHKTAEVNRQDAVLNREQWFKDAQWSVEARQELAGERVQTEAGRWQVAARRATDHQARASSHAVITEYLTELARTETWNPITYTAAEQRLHVQVRAGNLLATDDGCFTTWELARADRECVQRRESAAAGLAMDRAAAAGKVAAYREAAQAAGRRGLSGPQADAAAGILSAASGTVVVQGDAGAGKTTMLKAVNDLAAANGWEVKGVAVQGVAARKLQEESGIESTTLASYLSRERAADLAPQPAAGPRGPRLVVVDEASMLGSRDLSALLRGAAEHKDKVVLVGDRNQIQSVGAGKPFDRLVAAAEASGQLVKLTENYRQRDAQLRQAVDLARNGHMRASLDQLNQTHKIQEIEDTSQRRAAVAKFYDKDTLIVTGSRQSREELNSLIREELTGKGELVGGRVYNLTWQDEDGVKQSVKREIAAGERVVFLRNEYKDYDVRNGEVGTVTKTGKNTLGVRLEDGRQVELDLARYGAVDYGYALTTYKSQGQTYDKVVVEADTSTPQLQDQRNTYVQITRAREDVRIVTDDFFELRDVAGVLSVKADTNDLEISLADARRMEQRAREAALTVRAQQEAAAKVLQSPKAQSVILSPEGASAKAAQAPARMGAPSLEGGRSPLPERAANGAAETEFRVHNQALLDSARDSTPIRTARLAQCEQLEEQLRQHGGLTQEGKLRVAECLNSPDSAKMLERFKDPREAIAVAGVRSGAMSLKDAVKDLPANQQMAVKIYVRNDEIEKERSQERGREQSHEKDHGLDFSL